MMDEPVEGTIEDTGKREWVVKTTFQDGEFDYSYVRRNRSEAEERLKFQQRVWHMFTHEIAHFSEAPHETQDPIGDIGSIELYDLEGDPNRVERIKGVLENAVRPGYGDYLVSIFDDDGAAAPHSHWFDAGVPAMCDRCGRHYVMGLDGIVSGCDRCLKVKRDLAGHAWERGEMVHHYAEPDGTVTKVTRRQAFAFRNPKMRGRYDIHVILDKQGYVPDWELVGDRWELA